MRRAVIAFLAACASPPATEPPTPEERQETGLAQDTGAATVSESLTVLSLNLRCLKQDDTPYATVEERLGAVATFVADQGVHALALQEVCVQPTTDALAILRDAVEAATGEVWSSAFVHAHLAWEGTPDEADEGVALLVRGVELEPVEVVYVSPGLLRRAAIAARLPQGPTLISTHLDRFDDRQREDQGRQTASWALAIADGPDVIVAGDLNDVEGSATHDALLDFGFVDASADLDPTRIDHVLVHRGAPWRPTDARLVLTDPPVSDHPGVLVTLAPAPADDVVVTRVTARVDVGLGHHLAVRGDAAPLSWDRGWWAHPAAADRWELVLTEVSGAFAFKTLVDDVTWQTGDDVGAQAGDEIEVIPAF